MTEKGEKMVGFTILAIWAVIAILVTLAGRYFGNELLMIAGVSMMMLTACVNDFNY